MSSHLEHPSYIRIQGYFPYILNSEGQFVCLVPTTPSQEIIPQREIYAAEISQILSAIILVKMIELDSDLLHFVHSLRYFVLSNRLTATTVPNSSSSSISGRRDKNKD